MNILCTIAYRGTAYHGFQVQKNSVTVCSVFQDALQAVLGQRVDVKGCSRTDAGVHALEFGISFAAETRLAPHQQRRRTVHGRNIQPGLCDLVAVVCIEG